MSDCRKAVARYEDTMLSSLIARGILQYPPGVGTLLMQKLETAYRVPRAVWHKILAAPDRYFHVPASDAERNRRRMELEQRFAERIAALVGDPADAERNA